MHSTLTWGFQIIQVAVMLFWMEGGSNRTEIKKALRREKEVGGKGKKGKRGWHLYSNNIP